MTGTAYAENGEALCSSDGRGSGVFDAATVVAAPVMVALYDELARIARGDISVLVLGETGVGKEVVARATHDASPRRAGPFVAIHCAALPQNLLESELFGHEKGAFTGASQAQRGLLESAEGGTVFLDELGEIPLGVQVKLLRAIETKRVLPLGSRAERPIDVRFVSATSAELETDTARSTFRADLYYRLAGYTVRVPPLRERRAEIGPLAARLLADVSRSLGREAPVLAADALEALEAHAWPGNVRELRNVIERAVLLCRGSVLDRPSLPPHLGAREGPCTPALRTGPPPTPGPGRGGGALHTAIEAAERERILAALARCAGNQTQAATLLGISRRTLVTRLSAYDLPRPRRRAAATGSRSK